MPSISPLCVLTSLYDIIIENMQSKQGLVSIGFHKFDQPLVEMRYTLLKECTIHTIVSDIFIAQYDLRRDVTLDTIKASLQSLLILQ